MPMSVTKRSTVLVADIPGIVDDPARGVVSIVGDHGGLALITGPQRTSGLMMGTMSIETEHGVLYLDPDTEVEISEEWPENEKDEAETRGPASSWSRGSWLQTYTGLQFYPMDPDPAAVELRDIARSLSMQCRYNGHVKKFYSVAEHCVLVSRLVPAEDALWGLLHDATEAYVGGMIRPLKNHMPAYREAEDRVMAAIAERFGLTRQMPASVKDADNRVPLDEKARLMASEPAPWDVPGEAYGVEIHAWSPAEAEAAYIARFEELTS